jgi:hypothetical protein
MPSVPDPDHVKPWYLRNITEALALDEPSGNVYVRTGFQGNIIISGNVNIPGNVQVFSSPEDPVHTHISEVGTSGILDVPYLPIGGNVIVNSGNIDANVHGNVGILTMPNVNASVTGNVIVSSGNVNANVSGNVIVSSGNINANVSGNVIVSSGNINANVSGNVNANVSGNVGIIGNVNVTQGTDPWHVDGNVGITGTVTTVPALSVGDYFGEPYAVPITPVVQLDGRYGIYTKDAQSITAGGGNATTGSGSYQVSSTSTLGSYGLLRSRRFNTYKPGQSLVARWYSKFDAPAAGTSQRMGLNNQENNYWFGYDNTTFGFLHVHGGRGAIYRITVSSYSGAQNVTVTLNGVAYVIAISAGLTTGQVAQQISQSAFGGLWLANQRDNTVELLNFGTGPTNGTFSISGSGTFSGSIAQVQAGVAPTNEWWYAGTDFTLPAWFNPQGFNQYELKYSWAGVSFFILNPSSGQFELVYQHLQTDDDELELNNPAFKIAILALNQGGSTPVTVKAASMMMGLEGITNRNSYTGSATTTATSLTQNILYQILSIQNPYTYSGTVNARELLLDDITVATQCNDPSQVYVFVEPVIALATGVDNYTTQDSQSVTVSYTNGTITQGQYFPVVTFVVGNTGSVTQFDLSDYRVVVPPGYQATIAVMSTAAIQKVSAAIVWYND